MTPTSQPLTSKRSVSLRRMNAPDTPGFGSWEGLAAPGAQTQHTNGGPSASRGQSHGGAGRVGAKDHVLSWNSSEDGCGARRDVF